MTTQYRALGVVGVITDGPMRDLDEIRKIGAFQYLATGVTPSQGDMIQRAVGVPVTVGGMTVTPGDMDVHGAVKFPADKMLQVLENAKLLLEREAQRRKVFQDPAFSLAGWKESIKKAENRSRLSSI